MSARNWTPGPYRVERTTFGRGLFIADARGNSIATMASNSTPVGMARERAGVTAATARLIAAAPALYDALAATPCTCTTVAGASHGGQTEQLLDEQCARCAALALADGEQS